jgi:purine-binding chemotaxis protein CheW
VSPEKQYCTFFVNGLLLGIESAQVEEIVFGSCLTEAPLAPRTIAGLINHRGAIVTAIAMRRQLEFPDDEESQSSTTIFVRCQGEVLGLIVDGIGDVLSVSAQDFEPPPESLRGVAKEMIIGAYKLPERLLLPLNLDKIG